MADVNALSELLRQKAYADAGGDPQGMRPIDKINHIFSTIGSGADSVMATIKEVLANKKLALDNQKTQVGLTPVGNYLGVPSNPQDIQNAAQQQTTRVPESIYPQQSAELENGGLPPGVQGPPQQAPAQTIPGQAPLNQGLQAFQQKYKMSPTTPVDAVPEVSKLAIMSGQIPMFINKTTNQVSFDPQSISMGYEPFTNLQSKQAADIAQKQAQATMPQKFMSGDEAKAQGVGTKNTTIITEPTLNLGERQDQFWQRQWTDLINKNDPTTSSSRSVLGTVGRANLQVNRALATLTKPTVTKQEAGNVMADIAAIYQNGAPTQFGMQEQGYKTLYGNIQNVRQLVTGEPTDVLPDNIKQRLMSVLSDMKQVNSGIINERVNLLENTQPNLIQHFPEQWKSFKSSLIGGNTTVPDNSQSQTVHVVNPQGQEGDIPMSQLQAALLKGYKQK